MIQLYHNKMDGCVLYLDIFQNIIEILNIKDAISLMSTCHFLYNNLYIKKLQFQSKITENILKQPKFCKLKKISKIFDNSEDLITNLDFLKRLKNLSTNNFFINQDLLKNLNLKTLNVKNCHNIVDVSYMNSLKKLKSAHVRHQGLYGLNLTFLDISNNFFINDVSFMKSLQVLHAQFDCGINQECIDKLALIELDFSYNKNIINLNHMKCLKKLYARGSCGVSQNSIDKLQLIELDASWNYKINNVSFMKTLKKLKAQYKTHKYISRLGFCRIDYEKITEYDGVLCGISQSGIIGLNLTTLDISDNTSINDVHFMKSLKKLNVSGICGVDQAGIKNLSLETLNLDGNTKISDISWMNNLLKLNAGKTLLNEDSNVSAIDDNALKNLDLIELHAYNNPKIKDVSFMKHLQIKNLTMH